MIFALKICFGLALFIAGLQMFGSALKSLSDPTWLAGIDNPWAMAATGFVMTLIVQSSSITTAVLVVLVAASQLSLPGAIGGVIGANLGTTITVWLAWLASGAFDLEPAARHVAIAHTLLNLAMAMVALPFARQIASLVGRF